MRSFGDEKKSDREQREQKDAAFARALQERLYAEPARHPSSQPAGRNHQEELDHALAVALEQQDANQQPAPAVMTHFQRFKAKFDKDKYFLSAYYDLRERNGNFVISEKEGLSKSDIETAQTNFKHFFNKKINNKFVISFFINEDETVREWTLYHIPEFTQTGRQGLREFIIRMFNRSAAVNENPGEQKQQDTHIFQALLDSFPPRLTKYILDTKEMREQIYSLNKAQEEKMGSDVKSSITDDVFKIPVLIPRLRDDPYDLFDLLKTLPDRDGRRQCAETREFYSLLEDVIPAEDVLQKIIYRNMALANPMRFFDSLKNESHLEARKVIIDYLNFDCIVGLFIFCGNKNYVPVDLDLLLLKMVDESDKPISRWREHEQNIFFMALWRLPLKKRIHAVFKAFKDDDISEWTKAPFNEAFLLSAAFPDNNEDELFKQLLIGHSHIERDVANFTLELTGLSVEKQEEQLRFLPSADRKKILDYINNLPEDQHGDQFNILIGIMLASHTEDEHIDLTDASEEERLEYIGPALMDAFFKYIGPDKQEALLLQKISPSPEKCMAFIYKNIIKRWGDINGCQKLLDSLKIKAINYNNIVSNYYMNERKKVAAAYNFDLDEIKLIKDDENNWCVTITPKEGQTLPPELKWNNGFQSTEAIAAVSLDDCDKINNTKLEKLNGLLIDYCTNSLKETCFTSPTAKRDFVENMLWTINSEETMPKAEDRILKLRKNCLTYKTALESPRYYPIVHTLGYLLGIILTPIIVGALIIHSIWNRPVEGKKTMDVVEKTVGYTASPPQG